MTHGSLAHTRQLRCLTKSNHSTWVRSTPLWLWLGGVVLVAGLLSVLAPQARAASPVPSANLALLPLNFEANLGQAGDPADVQYIARGKAYGIALTKQGAVLALTGGHGTTKSPQGEPVQKKAADTSPTYIRMTLERTDPVTIPTAEQQLPGKVNYFIGNDPSRWRSGVATYGRVRYPAVYPGVDLVYYGNQGHLEYDFDVAPQANPRDIAVRFEGADKLRLDVRGNLAIDVQGRQVTFERPVAYQWDGERRVTVAASYRLIGNAVHFKVGTYDRTKPLIIDPVLSYFSYLGGSGNDFAGNANIGGLSVPGGGMNPLGIDPSGNVYIVGQTTSLDFPTKNPFAPAPAKVNCSGCSWAFVTSVSPNGTKLNYSTYLGGTLGTDAALSVAVDASGNAYVAGSTYSNDFPVTAGAFQTICGPNFNNNAQQENPGCNLFQPDSAFVSKLNSSGALVASTFLGVGAGYCGAGQSTTGSAIAIDAADRVYVVGTTTPGLTAPVAAGGCSKGLSFPVTANALLKPPAYTTANDGIQLYPQDAFVSVLNSSLTTLLYSTLYGDTQVYDPNVFKSTKATSGLAVAVDATGNFYIGGTTQDGHLPTTASSLQPAISSCGGVDQYGNLGGGTCSFVAKFSPVTTANGAPANPSLVYGTYFGGLVPCCGAGDSVSGLAANAAGDLYVLGTTNYPGFPTTSGSYQPTCTGCYSAFISEFNATGTQLLASTLYGGIVNVEALGPGGGDRIYSTGALLLDKNDNVYITGIAASFVEQVNPITTIGGFENAPQTPFVAKFNSALSSLTFGTVLNATPFTLCCATGNGGLAVDSTGNIYLAGTTTGGVDVGTTETTPGVFQPNFGGGSGAQPSDAFVAKISNVVSNWTALAVQTAYQVEGKADYTVWRPASGEWYSTDGAGHSLSKQWGQSSDLPVLGDFDGDGKSDLAVFRPSNGYWYITQSSNSEVVQKQWGLSTDTPVAGDFDGDGKTDVAVFRASNGYWYITQSSNGEVVQKQWGESMDLAVVGDFDGDGKSDVAVYRPSTGYWYISQSSNGQLVSKQWGVSTDIPVTGDFDGDGKSDIAVYRPSTGTWYIVQSSNGQVVQKQWGESGDIPASRDYDGDGKTDIAVFRPSTGTWYVIQSSNGQVVSQQWGIASDVPVNTLKR